LRIYGYSIIISEVIIDFHTHVFPPGIAERRSKYLGRDATFSLVYAEPKAKLATVEDLIRDMDDNGIDRSVILNLGWTSHELCVETNDYILESVTRFPKRLLGFCMVQPLAGEEAVREVERCARNGARGIGEMRPDVQGFGFENPVVKAMIDIVIDHGLILLSHVSEPVGHQYFGKGKVTPDVIYPLIINFRDLKLVCAHWGGGLPFYALMPEVGETFKNVYFDTAATPFLYKPEIFKHAAEIIGAAKILFGSDYPLLSPKRIIDQLKSVRLSARDTAGILGGNARKLLSL